MFYILVILGTVFIAGGIFLEKGRGLLKQGDKFIDEIYKSEIRDENLLAKEESDRARVLEKRIDLLEELLFKKTLEEEVSESIAAEEEEAEREEDSFKQYQTIKEYEKENKSLDEISRLLKMNKGEVLLLKSLYKNS